MRLTPSGPRSLIWRGLAPKGTTLPLGAPQILIGELMSQTRIGIIRGIPALPLLLLLRIRWLGCGQTLLLLLRLRLLLWLLLWLLLLRRRRLLLLLLLILPLICNRLWRLTISRLIRRVPEVSGPAAVAGRTLARGGTKIGRCLGRGSLERLREGRRGGGIDVPIGGGIITIIVISASGSKIQMQAVRVHFGGTRFSSIALHRLFPC